MEEYVLYRCRVRECVTAVPKEFAFCVEGPSISRRLEVAAKAEVDYFQWIVALRGANALLRNVCSCHLIYIYIYILIIVNHYCT